MKILHTADWHLGQSLYGFDRLDEQRRFLGQLCEVVAEERPDAMVVAGDVFDISMPSAAAQRVYAEGLLAIHAAVPEMVIVIVAGNHDSASRLEIYRNLWRSHNVFVIGTLRRLADNSADYSAHVVPVPGKGYIAAVPYVYPHNFPPADGDRQQAFFQGLEKTVGEMNAEGLPTVLAAHLAVLGCDLTGHRRMQNDSLGTVDYVELPTLGTAYDYIALGHIHHPQTLRGSDGRAAYSGSPIAVGFDERYQHGVVIVDLEKGKPVEARAIGINDPRPLVTLPSQPAAFDDALAAAREFPADRKAYIRLNVLLDKPLPSDYNEQVAKALEGKACHYCTINVTDRRRPSRANALPDVTPEQLRQMTVGEVAARFFAAKGIPEKELADNQAKNKENDKDIDVRLIKNILRRPHPCLDIPAQQADNHSHNHCEYCSQPAAVGHIPAHGTLILFAKLLCYRDSKATADTVEKPMIIKLMEPVEPTAARAVTPRYFPTMMVSIML